MGKLVNFESEIGNVKYNSGAIHHNRKYKLDKEKSKKNIITNGLLVLLLALGIYAGATFIHDSYINKEIEIPTGYVEWTVDDTNYFNLDEMLDKEEKSVYRKELDELKKNAKKQGHTIAPGGPVDVPNLIPEDSPEYVKYQEVIQNINELINKGEKQERTSYGLNARSIAEKLVPFPTEAYNNSDEYTKVRIKYRMEEAYQEAKQSILGSNNGSEPIGGVTFYTLTNEYFESLSKKALLEALLDTISLNQSNQPENYNFNEFEGYINSLGK